MKRSGCPKPKPKIKIFMGLPLVPSRSKLAPASISMRMH